jgi:hypothetical protein
VISILWAAITERIPPGEQATGTFVNKSELELLHEQMRDQDFD